MVTSTLPTERTSVGLASQHSPLFATKLTTRWDRLAHVVTKSGGSASRPCHHRTNVGESVQIQRVVSGAEAQ
jgi:hypothetical protein